MYRFFRSAPSALAALAMLGGCASIIDGNQQQVLVRTVQEHREVAGVGCVLQNDVGRWFVTTPARVTIRKSIGQLQVDCRKEGGGAAYEQVESKLNGALWGNIVLTAGVGYLVDRQTGAGYDYPSVLTVVMQPAAAPPQYLPPPAGATVY